MTNFVQMYRSTDLNAPPLSGQPSSWITLLNACLVNGFGASGISITSITRTSTTATATCAAADILRLQTGAIVTISGAAQSDYNITASITVASATTFTYTVANSPTTPATGTIVFSTWLPITSITRSGTTATVTVTNANTSLRTGEYFTISGAAQSDYNGTFQITMVSSTVFTYQVANSPATPATGTITYAKAGIGWSSPFTGTNKAVYRSQNSSYPQFYFRVDETGGTAGGQKECGVRGYETMSDVDTGTGPFPTVAWTANGQCVRKSASADTTNRSWLLIGDNRCFYWIANPDASITLGRSCLFFGAINSFKPSDGYGVVLGANGTFNSSAGGGGVGFASAWGTTPDMNNLAIARASSQTGVALGAFSFAPFGNSNLVFGTASVPLPNPNPADGAVWVCPVYVIEVPSGTLCVRGTLPGMYRGLHAFTGTSDFDTITSVQNLAGVTLIAGLNCNAGVSGACWFDQFGPW